MYWLGAGRDLRKRYRGIGLTTAACALVFASGCNAPGRPHGEPQAASEIADFKTLFSQNCSGCHGADGRRGPGRILNDPLYLAVVPKDTIRQVIEHGRPGTQMPAWARNQGGPLEANQITALAEGMEKNWAKPEDFQGKTLPSYTGAGLIGDLTRGKRLFLRSCYACHARGGLVGPVTDPMYLSLVSDQNLRTSIIAGRPDYGMPDYRALNAGHALSDQDIADLVTYLASLRPGNAASTQAAP